jgi:glycosyltransferase involved in cell wall biosynthesis
MPLKTVLFPTFKRPDLVGRAVHRAPDQKFVDLEVVVVVDGLDNRTVSVPR